ncbi:unnamed protein product, partial [Prorocentrum cordatum]
ASSGAAQGDLGGEVGTRPMVSYSAGISACEKGEQWQRALALLREMWEAELEPSVILQCRDKRVRERRAVAAGPGAVQRGVGGEVGARSHSATMPGSARAGKANSGRRPCPCSAWCGRQSWSPVSSLPIALGSSRARRASSGGRLCRCSARWCRRSWSAASSATALGSARARKPTVSTVLASVGSASSLGRALSAYDGPGLLPYASSPLISDVFERPRACVQRRDQRVREGRAVAAIRVDVQRDGAGDVGARCQPLPHRDQRVREREAVSAAPVPARRDVAGEGGLSRPELQRQYQHTR